ncbi:DEAD/DEAH box helicase [Corynebacterium glutamicum]|uniref:DEAD/DEAH box helicase n=1 Tax=Corynebacterium glutamicum TaxID=1718 RepID=UPI000721CE8C|nr:DEAD/DEAH box helicase [Corynebacterium glutamicum]ALP49492.1 helicase [Corynebacterium glutamicum]
MSSLIPVHAAGSIQEGITEYLTTSFSLADKQVATELKRFLGHGDSGMFHGPYVRARLPYAQAQEWEKVLSWLPENFVPYHHQKAAFQRLSSLGNDAKDRRPDPTLVVTGTGSGKTESFLYPILDHALRLRKRGQQGIKALLLYPMNALANDQADRLARLIHNNPALKGVTAGIYTGEAKGNRTQMGERELINDPQAMRVSPPDILLTNYKMLDQLLLRSVDREMWQKSATSLQYLVLDEFHTYDGAQGTDVALLLRRLGLMLKSQQPANFLDDSAMHRPLGIITPVATSATLGSGDSGSPMLDFAYTIFGERFPADAIVGETRLELDQWRAEIAQNFGDPVVSEPRELPTVEDIEVVLDTIAASQHEDDYAQLCFRVFCEKVWLCEADLHAAINAYAAHDLTAAILQHAADSTPLSRRDQDEVTALPELVLGATARILGEVKAAEFISHALAAMAFVRAEYGKVAAWGAKRLPGVETHLWVREVSRIDRALGVGDEQSMFRWSDDGPAEDANTQQWLPACYCRSCGRSGWMVSLEQGTNIPVLEEQKIRLNSFEQPHKQRALLDATSEQRAAIEQGRSVAGPRGVDGTSAVLWFHSASNELSTRQPSPEEEQSGSSIAVLTHFGPEADDLSAKQTCPSCGDIDSIRYIGSGISTLLSVSLSNLFGMADLDSAEKKTLVFADSVQDAAHRAGYVQARSRAFALRTYTRRAVGDNEVTLPSISRALMDNATSGRTRYELLPPDLTDLDIYKPYWHPDASKAERREASRNVHKRLSFDLALEFGQRADLPRSLALTGALSAFVDLPKGVALSAAAEALYAIEVPTLDIEDDDLRLRWVQGALELLRTRGGINHEWFGAYLRTDGNPYMLNRRQARAEGIPGFVRGGAPEFPRVGSALSGSLRSSTGTTTLGSPRGRYASWTSQVLGISTHDAATAITKLFDALNNRSILSSISTDSGGKIYCLEAERIRIFNEDHPEVLECSVCHAQTGVADYVRDLLDGAPCFSPSCGGVLHIEEVEDNYYRRLYSAIEPRTVIAREHTSMLKKKDRLALEQSFRGGEGSAKQSPDAPNVLVATPTLEMGIDIDDLSTVMLASLPTSVASYVQRVGRAGRLSGNSLVLAVVRGRGVTLPRLNQPLSMIKGAITPPVAYLSASEILHRQFLAYVIDCLDTRAELPKLESAIDVFDNAAGKTPLVALLKAQIHAGLDPLLEEFVRTLNMQISIDNIFELSTWASGNSADSLLALLETSQKEWMEERRSLTARRGELEKIFDKLDARNDAHDEELKEEKRKTAASLKAVKLQIRDLLGEFWIAALERYGLLPNFTLVDDSVELNVAVTSFNPQEVEFDTKNHAYSRGISAALFELAPGATFYAQGIAAKVDSIEIGEHGSAIEQWRLCPVCSHSEILQPGVSTPGSCPTCGSPAFADKGQILEVVQMRKVSSAVEKTRAAISDDREDRFSTRFNQHVSFVVPPDGHGKSWYLNDGFGIEHLPKVELRWLNLGIGNGQKRRLGGFEVTSPLFNVCRHCGHLDSEAGANSRWDHRPWCPHRYEQKEDTVSFALGRALKTQGVLMLLPEYFGSEADSMVVTSLIAAIKLGFREVLGGDPDHLDVTSVQVPRTSGDGALDALLLHDQVPGGTGYLNQFADPDKVRELISRAWERVSSCECQHDERLACPECLLPYTRTATLLQTSRAAAEKALRAILLNSSRPEEITDLSAVPDWTFLEKRPENTLGSQLELRFRVMLRRALKNRHAKLVDRVNGSNSYVDIEMSSGVRWRMSEQVDRGYTRPDFWFEPLNGNYPTVAVFTDGAAFHISSANYRLDGDIQKRMKLALDPDNILPWNITSLDLDRFSDPAAQGEEPAWFSPIGRQLSKANMILDPQSTALIAATPMDQLLAFLDNPAASSWKEFAHIAAAHMLGHNPQKDGDGIVGTFRNKISLRATMVNREPRARQLWLAPTTPEELEVDTWTAFLNLANLMWLAPESVDVSTNGSPQKIDIVPAPAAPLAVEVPELWAPILDGFTADEDEEAEGALQILAKEHALVPETTGDELSSIPTIATWPSVKIALLYESDPDEPLEDDLKAEGWTLLFANDLETSDIPAALRP